MARYIGKKIADGVYETTQYDKFKFGNNRPVKRKNVEKKKQSIKRMGLLDPIVVTSDYFIKDGQNRFVALKELGKPIIYRFSLSDTFSIDEISESNSTVDKWTTEDFVAARASTGDESFIRIKHLLDKYSNIGWQILILAFGKTGHNKRVKEGTLQITEEEFLRADVLLHQAETIYSLISDSQYSNKHYLSVFVNLLKFNLVSYENLYDAMAKRKVHLWATDKSKPASRKDALARVEYAYNYNRIEKNRIDIIKKYDHIAKGGK